MLAGESEVLAKFGKTACFLVWSQRCRTLFGKQLLADPPVAYACGSERTLTNRDRQGVGAFDSGYALFEFCKYLESACPIWPATLLGRSTERVVNQQYHHGAHNGY
jgi:hypothetical protein